MTSVSQLVLKMWPARLERRPKLAKIVDAAIEDDGDRAVLIVHRLVSAGGINDGETSMPERNAWRDQIAFAVRSAMA